MNSYENPDQSHTCDLIADNDKLAEEIHRLRYENNFLRSLLQNSITPQNLTANKFKIITLSERWVVTSGSFRSSPFLLLFDAERFASDANEVGRYEAEQRLREYAELRIDGWHPKFILEREKHATQPPEKQNPTIRYHVTSYNERDWYVVGPEFRSSPFELEIDAEQFANDANAFGWKKARTLRMQYAEYRDNRWYPKISDQRNQP